MARDILDLQEQNRDLIDLTRLLSRLDQKLLSNTDQRNLPHSNYERRKVGANIEYAHSLILRLEHASSSTKTASRSNNGRADLQPQRALLKKLQNRLHELDHLDDDSSHGRYADDDTAEDLLAKYAPQEHQKSTTADREAQSQHQTTSTIIPTSTLRPRHGATQTSENMAAATGSSIASDRAKLLPPSGKEQSPEQAADTSANEKLLVHHTSEQENITSSLLNLATALKQSTISFSDEIASSNPLVDRATASLDRNLAGMEAAERRMGLLRRMTEGKSWWARLGLYGWIAGLWVVLILVMFVMPKLRF